MPFVGTTNNSAALVTALYGPNYPPQYSFDILTSTELNSNASSDTSNSGHGRSGFITHAIVYTDETYRNWQVAKTGSVKQPLPKKNARGESEAE
jgi:hypothetical protein